MASSYTNDRSRDPDAFIRILFRTSIKPIHQIHEGVNWKHNITWSVVVSLEHRTSTINIIKMSSSRAPCTSPPSLFLVWNVSLVGRHSTASSFNTLHELILKGASSCALVSGKVCVLTLRTNTTRRVSCSVSYILTLGVDHRHQSWGVGGVTTPDFRLGVVGRS